MKCDYRCEKKDMAGQDCKTCVGNPAASAGYSALAQKLDEYIAFLDEANHVPVSVAYVHGWRCPQKDIDKGERLRMEIAKLREAL